MTALYLIDGSREILIYLHDLYEYTDDAIKQLSQWTPEVRPSVVVLAPGLEV